MWYQLPRYKSFLYLFAAKHFVQLGLLNKTCLISDGCPCPDFDCHLLEPPVDVQNKTILVVNTYNVLNAPIIVDVIGELTK